MFLKICTVNKCPVTHVTMFRLLSVVSLHVVREGTCLAESLLANVTLVRFFTCVYSAVINQPGRLSEAFATYVTPAWFFSCVDSFVVYEGTVLCKGLVADVAFVRPLSSVNSGVYFETSFPIKPLTADFTHVQRGRIALSAFVHGETVVSFKCFVTQLTRVWFIVGVLELMFLQLDTSQKHFVAGVAHEHVRSIIDICKILMLLFMTFQLVQMTKGPVTHVTSVRLLFRVSPPVYGPVMRLFKRLIAIFTLVRSFARVDTFMRPQRAHIPAQLVADITHKLFLSFGHASMHPFVSFQQVQVIVGHATHIANVWLLACMQTLVFFPMVSLTEGFVAKVTFERSLSCMDPFM